MRADEIEREWSAWLEERKRPAAPDPEFTRRVMEAVRAEARRSPASRPDRRRGSAPAAAGSDWLARLRALLAPRPSLAFAALALAAVLAGLHFVPGARSGSEGTRIKGGDFRIAYLLKRGAGIAPAANGDRYRAGDRLQAVYSSDRAGHIRLYSLGASGRIACLSCGGSADGAAPPGQEKILPYALELDGDPQDEALVGIWTAAPLPPALAESRLRAGWERCGGELPRLEAALSDGASPGMRITVFLLRKKVSL